MRHKGGGHKRKYRVIDFKRDKENIPGKVKSIEYDPNRTAYIALIVYADGEKRYILAPNKLNVGDTVMSGPNATPDVGNALYLDKIPLSTSNPDHSLQVLGKAGRKRWLGRRPRVRGVAMNPVDHPMGGGEGKSSGGHPRSRTGIMAKGQKTRNPKKASSRLIISKRKKKN